MNDLRPASSSNIIVTSTIVWSMDMGVLLVREEIVMIVELHGWEMKERN